MMSQAYFYVCMLIDVRNTSVSHAQHWQSFIGGERESFHLVGVCLFARLAFLVRALPSYCSKRHFGSPKIFTLVTSFHCPIRNSAVWEWQQDIGNIVTGSWLTLVV